jgi:hypothetical protein
MKHSLISRKLLFSSEIDSEISTNRNTARNVDVLFVLVVHSEG